VPDRNDKIRQLEELYRQQEGPTSLFLRDQPPPRAVPRGEIQQGNIDLTNRPRVPVPGTNQIATVRSMGINVDGKEVVIPTVSDDGRLLTPDEAVEQFRRTGRHLGSFDTQKNASDFGRALHRQQAKDYR
jgi:hypothetical protein